MTNIFKQIDQVSFKQIFSFSVIIAILIAIPITVWTAQQKTETQSSAYFGKPEPVKQEYGNPPSGNPQISLVWPFVGKVEDAVIIQGNNFGNNPKNKKLYLGNTLVPEDFIKDWQSNEIVFHVPPDSQFGPIKMDISGKQDTWTYPFTVYSTLTKMQVTENNGVVWVKNNTKPVTMTIFFRDGEQMKSDNPTRGINYPQEKQILSVEVTDKDGNRLPFYVEPSEFGF